MAERDVLRAVILRLGQRRDVRLWRQNTGVARAMDDPRRVIRFGIIGGGDASGIVAPFGTRLEIETKTATGRAEKSQLAFGEMIRAFGGIYIRGNDVDEIEAQLDDEMERRAVDDDEPTMLLREVFYAPGVHLSTVLQAKVIALLRREGYFP